MNPPVVGVAHLLAVLILTVPLVIGLPRARSGVAAACGLLALTPIPLAGAGPRLWGGEWFLEWLTEATLLAAVVLGGRTRSWLVAVGAAVILAEELSWGQMIVSYRTPAWFPVSDRSPEVNLHNHPGLDGLSRMGPAAAVFLAALAPKRVRSVLPMARGAATGVVLALTGTFATRALVGEKAGDESLELALAAVAVVGWAAGLRESQTGAMRPPAANGVS